MMIRTCLRATFAVVTLALLMAPAVVAQGEGQAVGVNPDAVARLNSGDRVLVVGSDVSVGETVVTGPRGQVQIVFADQTRLAVGPSSTLKIETYLMRSNGTAETLAVNALAGSFRFISGNSPKSAYQINTPTATIGVRGTKFDILVGGGQTRVMLFEGALRMCSPSQECTELADQCELGVADTSSAEFYDRDDPERLPLSSDFYFARFQAALLAQFRVNGATTCLSPREGNNDDSIIETMPGEEKPSSRPPSGTTSTGPSNGI